MFLTVECVLDAIPLCDTIISPCSDKWKMAPIFFFENPQKRFSFKMGLQWVFDTISMSLINSQNGPKKKRKEKILSSDWGKCLYYAIKHHCTVTSKSLLFSFRGSSCSLCPQEKITQLLCSDLIKYISSSSTLFLLLYTMFNVFNTVFQTHTFANNLTHTLHCQELNS